MSWSVAALIDFACKNDPGFAATRVGLSDDEMHHHALLPKSYREFLQAFGHNSGGFLPFGPAHDHRPQAIAEPTSDEPLPSQLVLIARDTAFTDDACDVYLDCSRSDGDDAPLVQSERGLLLSEQPTSDTGETLRTRLTTAVFLKQCIRPRVAQASILVGGDAHSDVVKAQHIATTTLVALGFAEALPALPHVACFQTATAAALCSRNDVYALLTLRVAHDDAQALDHTLAALVQALPHARVARPRTITQRHAPAAKA